VGAGGAVSDILLRQGDCLDLMQDIDDAAVDMVLVDLPYGITDCAWDAIIPLQEMWVQLKRITKPRAAIVMTASQPFTTTLIASNMKMFKYCWVWEKNMGTNFLNLKYAPMKEHEDVVVFGEGAVNYNAIKQPRSGGGVGTVGREPTVRATDTRSVYGTHKARYRNTPEELRVPRSIQRFDVEKGQHPTQKPVSLMKYMIETYTDEGQTVLDFTMGSGTTGVACISASRNFIGFELDDEYFAAARKRIGDAADGVRLFEEVRITTQTRSGGACATISG
jgi:site-specific DNA-methyltransferase (adenine-specific)